MAVQPFLLGTIAMSIPGKHSSNDFIFSIKIQTKSVVEILILAIPFTGAHFHFAFCRIVPQPERARKGVAAWLSFNRRR
jgi:hypothetical protein